MHSRTSAMAPISTRASSPCGRRSPSKVNVTYKLLYNDAVAMTGGQPLDGKLSVEDVANQLYWEGVRPIVVVTDEPEKYPATIRWPEGTTIRHRKDLELVQKDLQQVKGVSALVYDQTCAAEKRRRRKRGTFPNPPETRLHQPGRLRGVWRLQQEVELRERAASRYRVRPQAQDRPVQLQQGLQLPRRFLPVVCHGARWRTAQGRSGQAGR